MATDSARESSVTDKSGTTAPTPKGFDVATQRARNFGLKNRPSLQIADLLALTASAYIGALILSRVSAERAGSLGYRDVALTAAAMAVALHLHGLYRRPSSRLRPSEWWRPSVIARCLPTAALLALAADALILGGDRMMTLTAAVAMTLPAIALVPLGRRLVIRIFDPLVIRILVVGTGPISERLTARLERCPDMRVVGHVDDNVAPDALVLGGLADLPIVCAAHEVDRVIVALPNTSDAIVLEALRQLQGRVPISEVPRYFELHNWRSEAEELHGLTLMHLPTASMGRSARILKRAMDITISTCALILAAPVLLIIAVAVKSDTPGPVLFRQERIGRGGRPFKIFKFRSMSADAWQRRGAVADFNQADGPMFKMARDPRITRVGAIIRKTSLDELPQLINVVRGEMSLVGPRPFPTEQSDGVDGAALARLDVKPGITGLWQVSGRSDLSYADLQHLDSVYVQSWSLMWDLRIMLQTPGVVLGRTGAY